METFGLHGLILCVSEGDVCELICIHIVGKGTSGLHGLILCVSEGDVCELICIHIVSIETSLPHELILCENSNGLSFLPYSYNDGMGMFHLYDLILYAL